VSAARKKWPLCKVSAPKSYGPALLPVYARNGVWVITPGFGVDCGEISIDHARFAVTHEPSGLAPASALARLPWTDALAALQKLGPFKRWGARMPFDAHGKTLPKTKANLALSDAVMKIVQELP
jgi:hypothetical protein